MNHGDSKEIHKRSEVIAVEMAGRDCEQKRTPPLFLEEAAQRAHHVAAAAVRRRLATVGATMSGAVVPPLVLLDRVFGDAAHDRATDCTEETVVGLVACVAAGRAACQSTGETPLAFLCLFG